MSTATMDSPPPPPAAGPRWGAFRRPSRLRVRMSLAFMLIVAVNAGCALWVADESIRALVGRLCVAGWGAAVALALARDLAQRRRRGRQLTGTRSR